jgi:hypothetical protein
MTRGGAGPPPAIRCLALPALLILQAGCGPAAAPDSTSAAIALGRSPAAAFDALLERHVHDGLVDYASLKKDPGLTGCVRLFGEVDPALLPGRSERLAFWINAYNLFAMKGVADSYPVSSIREIGVLGRFTFFRGLRFRAGQRECTLDTIMHKILRPQFHEPRIHFAAVSASLGSPRLRSRAFHPDDLEGELDAAARAFVLDPSRVRLDGKQGVLYLSPIFDWFGEDFDRAAGSRLDFIRRYLPPSEAASLGGGVETIRYLDFDWRLNDFHLEGRP